MSLAPAQPQLWPVPQGRMGGPSSPGWGLGWKMVVPGRSVLMTRGRAPSRAAAAPTRRGLPRVRSWDPEGEGRACKGRHRSGQRRAGGGVWIGGATRGRMGEGAEKKGRKSEGNTRRGQSQTVGQTDQRKEGGMGGRRVPGALNRPRRALEAPGWGLAAPSGLREGGGGHRGRDTGLTMARRGAAFDARAGGAGRAAASLPPLASRRVWLGDSSGRGGGSARSGSQAAGPRQGGPRRPPLPAPPFSARLRLRAGPPAGTPAPAPGFSAASPPPTADQPRSPATLFLPRPAPQCVARTPALGRPPCRGCPSFPATASLPEGSV